MPFRKRNYEFRDTGDGTCEIAYKDLVFRFAPDSYTVIHPDGVELKVLSFER